VAFIRFSPSKSRVINQQSKQLGTDSLAPQPYPLMGWWRWRPDMVLVGREDRSSTWWSTWSEEERVDVDSAFSNCFDWSLAACHRRGRWSPWLKFLKAVQQTEAGGGVLFSVNFSQVHASIFSVCWITPLGVYKINAWVTTRCRLHFIWKTWGYKIT
jgi:hypothetical protein